MVKIAVFTCVLLWSGLAEAVTWDFDDGTTQGWSAKEAFIWGGPFEFHQFPGEVEDGVWRVDVSARQVYPDPSVKLISSTIGYDSRLFDRVIIRFRTVHNHPTTGSVGLAWTNEHNFETPGMNPEISAENQFGLYFDRFVFTTEWQEVEFTLDDQYQDDIVWEGLLRDIQLSFSLGGPYDLVEHFEIDWIDLIGQEELSQGELARPPVKYFRFAGAGLFAPPIFYPITQGLGSGEGSGVLTDLDGDGDLDLFSLALWSGRTLIQGWVMAVNDGSGAFATVRTENRGIDFGLRYVLAEDVDGDGQDEIVIAGNREMVVWSLGPDFQIEVLTIGPDDLESLWDLVHHIWEVPKGDFDGDG